MSPTELTPARIVESLDKYIIGQQDAKRAVAVAVRNRWRRQQLDADIRREIAPKNIIMIGPTGVGKTEIARRLASLVDAPFIKVEATKFTEVGYHGRDVDSIIRDLVDLAIKMVQAEQAELVRVQAQQAAEYRLVSILLGRHSAESETEDHSGSPLRSRGYVPAEESVLGGEESSATRDRMLVKLREGVLDDRQIEISVRESQSIPLIGGMGADQLDPGMTAMLEQLMPARTKMRKVTVREARRILTAEETDKLIDREKMIMTAIERTEQSGIVFLDEIDKIAGKGNAGTSADVSRQGVQRDLLPIVEGSTVATRHGMVRTDHILFIAAGAFHSTSVSDLMPELQGRFPIRVELSGLTREDFIRILKEPTHSILNQQIALLTTEGLAITIENDAIEAMAEFATKANSTMENIGARRLMTIIERVFERVSFDAPDMARRDDRQVHVTRAMVESELARIVADEDLSRFVL